MNLVRAATQSAREWMRSTPGSYSVSDDDIEQRAAHEALDFLLTEYADDWSAYHDTYVHTIRRIRDR